MKKILPFCFLPILFALACGKGGSPDSKLSVDDTVTDQESLANIPVSEGSSTVAAPTNCPHIVGRAQ
ncbi:MAG: hypothetical protein M3Q07_01640, partial [Pseudobdellovibrionaceae bacterium]|nr:hypothetical protein [Pseudobdellovibrionaceae bacterium]